jgi:ABC-type transporter Mla subunit MlaD
MPVTQGAALALFLETELTRHDIHLAMIFIGIIAFSLVVAAISTVITGMFAAKLLHRVDSIANIVEQRTGPILDRTNDLLRDLGPKIHTVTTNVEQISYTVRAKVDALGETVSQLNETVQEINGRTRIHVAHVDGIVSDAIYATEELSQTVQQGIRGPLKQVAGVVAGLRAGLDTLIARSPFGRS